LHPFVCAANQIWKLNQHRIGSKKVGLHPLICGANFKLENCTNTPWQQENWAASICMWCKSNLKITLELEGLANFDNYWKEN
jgi:hypothetical protein